jgi:hypothetical protein
LLLSFRPKVKLLSSSVLHFGIEIPTFLPHPRVPFKTLILHHFLSFVSLLPCSDSMTFVKCPRVLKVEMPEIGEREVLFQVVVCKGCGLFSWAPVSLNLQASFSTGAMYTLQ